MGTQFPGLRRLVLFISYMVIVAVSSYAAMFVVNAYSNVNLDFGALSKNAADHAECCRSIGGF